MSPPRRWLHDSTIGPEMKRDLELMGEEHVDDARVAQAAAVFAAALAAGAIAATATGTAAAAATVPVASWTAKLGVAKGWLLAAGVTAAGGGVVGGVVVSQRQQQDAVAKPRRPVATPAAPRIHALPPVEAIEAVEAPIALEPAALPVAPRPRRPAPRPAARTAPVRAVAPAPAPPPPVAAQLSVSALTAETGLLADIAGALERGDPSRALALVKHGRAQFPGGQLGQERDAYGIFALAQLGRRDEARSAGRVFLARYPNGPFSAKVRTIVDGGTVNVPK